MSAVWGLLGAVALASAPQAPDGWSGPEARALVARAIEARGSVTRDSVLADYRARATGHVYFLFDLGAGTPRHVVKADQVALDLYWQAPGRTRQIIVGRREDKRFPADIHYHVDHLTVVMDNFGDRIRVGEGDEVRDALHPAARGALDFYEYRLSDSLALRLPDGEIRVVALDVRPRDATRPGIVGSIYLDAASAAIVRMDFTFTAASYLDPQLQYIHIVLENSLWQRRYWLPWRQGVELRRELEWLDFPAGGVIRAEFRIEGYAFNTGLPLELFRGLSVSQLPLEQREAYPFERDLYAGLRGDELRLGSDLREIAPEAVELVGRRYLEGLARRPRLFAAGGSSWLRYRRAEGLYLGVGASMGAGRLRLSGTAGHSIHAHRWEGALRVEVPRGDAPGGDARVWIEGYGRRVVDVARRAVAPGLIRTVGALADGEDYEEPYFVSGVEAGAGFRGGAGPRWGLFARLEEHEAARLAAPESLERLRGVRPMRAGTVWGGGVFVESPAAPGLDLGAGAAWEVRAAGFGGEFDWVTLDGRARLGWGGPNAHWTAEAATGASFGSDLPPQALFPVGGRGTLRGYEFHRFVGNRFATASLDFTVPLWRPWLTGHAFVDAGWTELAGPYEDALARWNQDGTPASTTDGVRTGAGVGLGFVYDILRLETARGLRGGTWEWIVSVHPAFWPWL